MRKRSEKFASGGLELITSWSEADSAAVASELQKLYDMQDRPLGPEKKAELVDEVSRSGLPPAAVIAGVRELMCEDLKQIKLATILGASRAKLDVTSVYEVVDCRHCMKSGAVSMQNLETKYHFVLACVCKNGERLRRQGIKLWNGERQQMTQKHGLGTLRFDTLSTEENAP